MENRRAIFLDRDGVINKAIIRAGGFSSPWSLDEFEIIDEVEEVLKEFKKLEFLNIIITNQPDIARGNLLLRELEKMHQIILERLPVDDIQYCPHDDKDNCDCRKPKPGMILRAAQKWNIDLNHSYVIGDRWKDIKASKAAGCKAFLIRREYNLDYQEDYDFEINNLKEVVEFIKKLENL
ncbi:MAG TPA: HAD family hydrolase [Candidatus Paceibacterota bacterium]|nr:HAD family hydrolase [Candidatus Paceibacterota bacterium]